MLSWWQWGVLAAIPPAIVLLYFLKLKRTPLEVPSTYLWLKSIEDLHVNSIWQRLRTSLLLLLQLLLVAIAMFALTRPGWQGTKLVGNRFIFLIDTSASMSSTDVQPTRLDEAKRRARELIGQMAAGDVAMIITFADSANLEKQGFTDNRRDLLRQIDAIVPTNRKTLLGEALRVASGLANPGREFEVNETQVVQGQPATLYIFSDGKFPNVEGFSLGNLEPVYVPLGEPEAANVGITAFSTRHREDQKELLQAFGRLENFGPEEVTTDVELYSGDTLLDADRVKLEPRGTGGVAFELGDLHEGVLSLRVRTGGSLKADDVAYAALDPPTRRHVLVVTPGNDALEVSLKTESASELAEVQFAEPAFLQSKEYEQKAAAGFWALVIYDQCQPKQFPQADTLFIGRLPPGDTWTAGPKVAAPQIIDIESAHPLMQLLDLGNVKFAEGSALKPPAGSTVLISTDAGPLLAIGPRDGFEDAVLAAEIVGSNEQGERYANSDWPLRLSFPVFVLNTLAYFGEADTAGGAKSVQPGDSVVLQAAGSSETLEVRTPSGKSIAVERQRGENFRFSDTDELGVYVVNEPKRPPTHFVVNLFDSLESDIEPRSEIEIGYSEVKGQTAWQGARRELWKLLLLGALFVLSMEWYIYNRRIV